jgi:hypothetical protein
MAMSQNGDIMKAVLTLIGMLGLLAWLILKLCSLEMGSPVNSIPRYQPVEHRPGMPTPTVR